MAWSDPKTWVTSELVTAALLNTYLRDNQNEQWLEIVRGSVGNVSTPGNAGIYALNNGTVVSTIGARTYPGKPVILEAHIYFAYEAVTADGGVYVGITDGAAVTANVRLLASGSGSAVISGKMSYSFTPSAASHTYNLCVWSGNGTGTDSAVGNGRIRLWERAG